MYKLMEIREDELQDFKEKIIQVIDSYKQDITVGYSYLNCPIKKIL